MLGKIYIIKNNINTKVYIGQTIQTLGKRFSNHKIASDFEDTKFYRAIRKHGKENFYIELIEEVPQEELNNRECYWIKFYDSYYNGYNSTLGGQGIREIDYERIYVLWNSYKTISEIAKETNHSRDVISRILKEGFQVKEEDIIARGYESISRLKDEEILELWNTGLTPNQITIKFGGDSVTTKRRLIKMGISEEEIQERAAQNQRNLTLQELDSFWKEGLSIAEIVRRSGSNTATIKKQLLQLGYTKEDFSIIGKQTCNQNHRAVVQLDTDNHYIAQYKSAKEAERITGAAASAISGCCHHKPKYKTAKGFKWVFLDEYERG